MSAEGKPRRASARRATTERRDEARSLAQGSVWVIATGYGTARCTLVDQSTVGAQLNAPVGLSVGMDVTLSFADGSSRRAHVQWVEADMVGIRFVR